MTFVQFIHFDTDVKTCTDCETNDEALQHIKLNYSISRRRVTLVFRYFRWTWEITGSLSRRATAWMRRGILGWSVCVRVAWRRYSVRNINTVLVIILAATTTANTGSKNILQISLFETPVYKPNSPRTYTPARYTAPYKKYHNGHSHTTGLLFVINKRTRNKFMWSALNHKPII